MKYFILILILFSSINIYADIWQSHPEWVSSRSCELECDPYDATNCDTVCDFSECASNETEYSGYCILVDCSLNPANPIQIGSTCTAKPACNLQLDEFRTSSGDCLPCPYPGVFDNDTCNICQSPEIYSTAYGACVETGCSEGYVKPHPNSTMCYRACQAGYKMDIFGNCKKEPDPIPECASNEILVNGHCEVLEPEPEPEECETVVSSINCLKNDVLNKLNNIFNLNSILDSIKEILTNIFHDLDDINLSNNSNNSNNEDEFDDVDTSPLDAELLIVDLSNEQLIDDIFPTSSYCPSDRTLNIWSYQYHFSFTKICSALEKLSYLVMLISFIFAASIIVRD